MEVNRANFLSVCNELEQLIETCEFFALDLEMSGISLPEAPECCTMAPEDLYRSKRAVAMKYNILQVGICLFHKKKEVTEPSLNLGSSSSTPIVKQVYEARPFNIFVFPYGSGSAKGDERNARDVALNPDTLAFLRNHSLDFQRWIYTGVPYLNKADAAEAKKQLEEDIAKRVTLEEAERAAAPLNDRERKWLEESIEAAKLFVKNECLPFLEAEAKEPGKLAKQELALPSIKSALAVAALRAAVESSPELHEHIVVRSKGRRQLKDAVFYHSPLKERENDKRERYLDQVGFRRIYEALAKSKKPCVGHHCFVDHLFMSAAFDTHELPEKLSQYKTLLGNQFTKLYDTKFLATYLPIIPSERFYTFGSGLGSLFKAYTCSNFRVELTFPLGFHDYSPETIARDKKRNGGTAAHEAGYDAMMTGCVFLNLIAEFGPQVLSLGENKIALFNSVYAVDFSRGKESIPFLPTGDEAKASGDGQSLSTLDESDEERRVAEKAPQVNEPKSDAPLFSEFMDIFTPPSDVLMVDHTFDSNLLLEQVLSPVAPVKAILRTTPSVAGIPDDANIPFRSLLVLNAPPNATTTGDHQKLHEPGTAAAKALRKFHLLRAKPTKDQEKPESSKEDDSGEEAVSYDPKFAAATKLITMKEFIPPHRLHQTLLFSSSSSTSPSSATTAVRFASRRMLHTWERSTLLPRSAGATLPPWMIRRCIFKTALQR